MRSFFKKPDWAKSGSNPGQSADFYRRSEQVYTDIISREPEEEGDENEDEDEVDDKQGSRPLQGHRSQETQSRDSKRRRISREESVPSTGSQILDSHGREKPGEDLRDIKKMTPAEAMTHTKANSPPNKMNNEPPPAAAAAAAAAVVELASDSDEDPLRLESEKARASQPHNKQLSNHNLDGDNEDSNDGLYEEEEYAQLARKARERARQRLAASANNSGSDTKAAPGGTRAAQSLNPNHTITKSTGNTPNRQSQRMEPIVRILITSDIPNTSSLIVQRRLNQDLRDVRRAWCSRQGFDDDMTTSVFLTWKGRRLFDVTTCKSLGVQQEKEKGLLQPLPIRNYYDDDDDDRNSGQYDGSIEVHMEAVTEKLFEEKKRQAIKASQRNSGGSDEDDDDDDGDDDNGNNKTDEDGKTRAELGAQGKQVVLLLTLKAPGIEHLKIRVNHKTLISSIIRSFREKRGIPAHCAVELLFDGAQLHPDSVVGDNDMADLDAIDVRIK
ncbi:conserved hypothetical protein [Histoplasma capsulatum var. duboisii H88]|uniref:Ubiquitin-2 like Rad60 SUMO-like domain-containing protein n=1 Tax=Ajellomyces capsulatus (strain H88) TaxID=544711 RepID=F0UW54_AJEC8|nr:conserved hypothetical protein [Histoplasma capsulatum var. duboisii H88]QSS57395.1 Ubiquitin-2 like Rad60 SUMO-like domain-containing protein [Histoplasma capsulatum var. duboisii H88]